MLYDTALYCIVEGWGLPHPERGRRALSGLHSVVSVWDFSTPTPVATQAIRQPARQNAEKACERTKKRTMHFDPKIDAHTEAHTAIYSNS